MKKQELINKLRQMNQGTFFSICNYYFAHCNKPQVHLNNVDTLNKIFAQYSPMSIFSKTSHFSCFDDYIIVETGGVKTTSNLTEFVNLEFLAAWILQNFTPDEINKILTFEQYENF